MSSDIAQMKLRAQQSQVMMMHETTDRKGKERRLQVVGDASHAFNSKAKGTRWVAELLLYVMCSLHSSHRASISKGSVEIRGLTHFVDVPPHYHMSPVELEAMRKELDKLLANRSIEPSISPYGAPVLFIKKKDGD